jgi:hypothetical protein
MTSRTLTTYAAAGYFLGPKVTQLTIAASGGVGGFGVQSDHFATVVNYGEVSAANQYAGVFLSQGGIITNEISASLSGYVGVYSNSYLTLYNDGRLTGGRAAVFARGGSNIHNGYAGTIIGDVNIDRGEITNLGTMFSTIVEGYGGLTNGARYNTDALIVGGGGVYIPGLPAELSGRVVNFGTIAATGAGPGHLGVNIGGYSGEVDNGRFLYGGSPYYQADAAITGDSGVLIQGYGNIRNGGTIEGTGTLAGASGVTIGGNASIVNGSDNSPPFGNTDTAALIEGYAGVHVAGAASVRNFGTIEAKGTATAGVFLGGGGSVVNGNDFRGDTVALIEGALGLEIAGVAGTLANYGTIRATGSSYGVELLAGGRATNSGAAALIVGGSGVGLFATGTVTNSGTIEGTGAYGRGVYMTGGYLKNGSASDTSALIIGDAFGALLLDGPTTVINYGSIVSNHAGFGSGVNIENGVLVNGAKGDRAALIYGFTGLYGGFVNDTVTNFGTIGGSGGTALSFSSASDTLIVEARCRFIGAVQGGGGTLVLDSGTGTLALLAGDTETVSGSMAATTFSAFATVEIGAGATFASSGKVTIAAGQSVIDLGALTLGSLTKGVANAGTLTVQGGTLTVIGDVSGKGLATIDGGLLDFTAAFGEDVRFSGKTGTLELAQSTAYGGTISGFSTKGKTFLDLDDIAFGKHTTVSYSGTKTAGVLTVTDGTHTAHIDLKGD